MTLPKIIHQFWTGNPMSQRDEHFRADLQDKNPDWEYKFYTGTEDLKWLNMLYIDAHHYSSRPHVFRSNLVRYENLYIYGGVAIDVDKAPIRSLNILPDVDVLVATNGNNPDPGVLGAIPRHPFIASLIELASQQLRNPYTATQGCEHLDTILAKYPDIPVQPHTLFYPRTTSELKSSAILYDPYYLKDDS